MKRAPVVLIRWMDASCYPETDRPERDARLMAVTSVGIVVAKDRNRVALAPSVFEDGSCRDVLSIPRACIKSVTRL